MNFWRNISAASFPLFTDSLYARMGIHGASTFVAGIATILAIIPFVAFRYGQRLRAKSRFAKTMADIKRKVEASRVANEP